MSKETKTFVQKVVAFIKADDDSKVASFQKQSLKTVNKQIKENEEKLAEIKEKKEEYQNDIAPETVLNVHIDSIKTVESRKNYFKNTYLPTLLGVKEKLDNFDEEIEVLEAEIDQLKWAAEQLN
jgi:flagellar biosynthesis chaperone FliJ